MNKQTVSVLTPHGRRPAIKIEPGQPLMQILTEVCKKYELLPDSYDLKHHRTILDLTIPFRYSGLPNNAQLEMVTLEKPRNTSDTSMVTVGLQLANGNRLTDEFQSNQTLREVLEKLCPDVVNDSQVFNETVIVYMRTEIGGSDSITKTTLKSLGLCSGRAMLRVLRKIPGEEKTQSNVSSILQAQKKPIEDVETKAKINDNNENSEKHVIKNNEITTNDTTNQNQLNVNITSNSSHKLEGGLPLISPVERKKPKINEDENDEQKTNIVEPMECDLNGTSTKPLADKDTKEITEIISKPEFVIIGERNAILFRLGQSSNNQRNDNEIPDSFFDLNVHDIKLLLKELRTQTKDTHDAPLMTAKMREEQQRQENDRKLNIYKSTIIRIQFPERLVLQGEFKPTETIEDVLNFVKLFIDQSVESTTGDITAINELIPYLYTTPPKIILQNHLSLIDVGCVPRALLHFGCSSSTMGDLGTTTYQRFIKIEYLAKLSTPYGAISVLSHTPTDDQLQDNLMDVGSPNDCKSSLASSSTSAATTSSGTSSASTNAAVNKNYSTSGDIKVPKWFKPTGKQ